MYGQKHLLKCRCILTQFKGIKDPPLHQFIVFSEFDDDDKIKEKLVQCNNCGIIHKVIDILKSEIVDKKESSAAIIGIEEIKSGMHQNIASILEKNNADLPTWEACRFYIENKLWGSRVTVSSELEEDSRIGKVVTILGDSLFKVDTFSREEFVKDE